MQAVVRIGVLERLDAQGGGLVQDAAADRLLAKIVAVASGKLARNEVNEERAIGIWKSGVTL